MNYVTDRKRAAGSGSGRQGTHHHWQMMVTSMLLVVAVPAFLITVGIGFSGIQEDVTVYFGRPLPALITGLSLSVIVIHTMRETHAAIEDYVHGVAEKILLVVVTAFSYTLIAIGLFVLAKMAL